MLQLAAAKINLFLHIGDKRADGFHALQSLAVFTDAGDRLQFAAAPELSLALDGPFAAGLAAEDDNLVLRAARALSPLGAHIVLTKNLPVASGIGGGSADAAAALRGLGTLWNMPYDDARLCGIAVGLGSDIPVCISSLPSFMQGRGEIIRPVVSMPRLSILLVNPGVAVPTRDVFATLQGRRGVETALPEGRFDDTADLLRFLETTGNDLEAPARALQPVIGTVLDHLRLLPGALLARMSGSGATCFALFPDDESCARGASQVKEGHPGWWVEPTFAPELNIVHEGQGRDIGPTDRGL